ncbi:Maf family protein [Lamprobacter modestohalophilus]|uniref:Maf family protein n=1 Tax=Lamprobacter modestohalophilus TaxID=1064514 RepID=UPI002ADED245|nr:Maf family protein [Lamprobacter modestohalophilus]MEA1050891.1 Maf family protein [Lamprobacter modestohalophilus]
MTEHHHSPDDPATDPATTATTATATATTNDPQATDLYLASRSPRRLELLAQLGLRPKVVVAEIDETPADHEAPEAFVARIAQAKAQAGWASLNGRASKPLLAADTAVVIGAQILGKPADADAALRMLALLSGRQHRVLTAVTLLAPAASADPQARNPPLQRQVLVETEVQMRPITPAEARAYWASGEPSDKAGAYAVQGLGAIFVEAVRGSYSNVVGLPLFETAQLLREQGVDPLALPITS